MSTSSLYESVWKIMDRSEAVAQVPAPLGKAPQLNASIEALLDGIDAPAFPNEAFSVVAPMRNAQQPDTCRTSKGATTRLAACAYLCGNQHLTARSSTRRLLDGVVGFVPHRSTEPGRPRGHPTHWLISTQARTTTRLNSGATPRRFAGAVAHILAASMLAHGGCRM